MKVKELKEKLEILPDDAEVTYRKYLNKDWISLCFSLGPDIWFIHIKKEYKGLPR